MICSKNFVKGNKSMNWREVLHNRQFLIVLCISVALVAADCIQYQMGASLGSLKNMALTLFGFWGFLIADSLVHLFGAPIAVAIYLFYKERPWAQMFIALAFCLVFIDLAIIVNAILMLLGVG